MTNSRVVRGRRSTIVAARLFQDNGVPDAEPTFGSEPGRDIKRVPGVAPEVKARRGFNPMAWLRQARRNAGTDLPVVILRCDGQGEESVGDWLMILRAQDGIDLMRKAGFW